MFNNRPSSPPPGDGVNLDRASLRVESMQTYAIVSSIIMGSSIGILSLNDDLGLSFDYVNEDLDASNIDIIAQYLLLGLQAVSLVASSYTTVVFTLMALYYATALGLGGDECYQAFDDDTKALRMRAFYSFVTSIVTLMLSFLPCAYFFIRGIKGIIMTAFLAALVSLAFYDFKRVIDSAGRTIFNPLFNMDSTLHRRASQRRLSKTLDLSGKEDAERDYALMQDEKKEFPRVAEIRKKDLAQIQTGQRPKYTPNVAEFDTESCTESDCALT